MGKTEKRPVFSIYLKDFNAQVMELGERMGIPLSVKTRYGVTGDYMEDNPHKDTAEKCFYLEIMMFNEHVLFRAFTQRWADAEKVLFMDGVKKELYKLAIQLLAQQQIFLLNNQQPNGQNKLDLEDPPGYPAKSKRLPSKASASEDSTRKEGAIQPEDGSGLAEEGGHSGDGDDKKDDVPKDPTPRK